MDVILKENERIDDLERNGYRIIQNSKKFCFGMDAVLLSGFAAESEVGRSRIRIADLGTGTGIIPLLLHGKLFRADHSARACASEKDNPGKTEDPEDMAGSGKADRPEDISGLHTCRIIGIEIE